ncbi:MAG: hypothetical protein M0Z34_04095 [Nitrospiraceae bacterium]|nr:hypothetical protein [Nitrospiraceae bacterium]
MGQYKSVRKLALAALLVLSVLALGHSEVAAATSTAGQSQTLALAASSPAYDMVASDGGIFSFGDATFYGSMGGTVLNKPIVGMASTPDGKGYWLVASDGGIFSFGDAQFHGSMGGTVLNKPIVGMASDPATGGYWLVASDGGIFSFDAPFYGSMGGTVLNQPIVGIASLSTDPYATGQVGADVSFPQCPYPTINQPGIQAFPTNTGVGVVGVNFEAVDITPGTAFPAWNQSYATNPCLGSEFQMAQAAGAHASLYAVLWTPSAPSSGDSQLFTGPESACASATPNTSATSLDCQAYDWGYNIATADLSYAAAQGAYSNLWWLDVEGPYSTSSAMLWGSDTTVNENVIAGAVAAFQSAGRQVGIYSTYYQFPRIAGSTYSPGLPIWMATGDTVGNLPWYCTAPSFFFGGGTPWLIQGAPTQLSAGSNSYNVDPDYAC